MDDAINFEKNVERIVIVEGNGVKDVNWSGHFVPGQYGQKGYIRINGEYFKSLLKLNNNNDFRNNIFQSMYETLTHEVFHGIANNITGTALDLKGRNTRN